MLLSYVRNHLAGRIPECIILAVMCLLVAVNLFALFGVDIWRQDSMYYVTSYSDKLAEEGRWIDQWANLPVARAQLLPKALEQCGKGFSVTGEHYRSLAMGRIELRLQFECDN